MEFYKNRGARRPVRRSGLIERAARRDEPEVSELWLFYEPPAGLTPEQREQAIAIRAGWSRFYPTVPGAKEGTT